MDRDNDSFKSYIRNISTIIDKKNPTVFNDNASNRERIITKFNRLDSILSCSKKLPLISHNNLFFEEVNNEKADKLLIDSKIGGQRHRMVEHTTYLVTNNLDMLQNWYDSSVDMIKRNNIMYFPYIEEEIEVSYQDEAGFMVNSPLNTHETKSILKPSSMFKATPEADFSINDSSVVPLFNFEIPYLENISPSELSQLMIDYPDELLRLRYYLQRKLINIESKLFSEDFIKEVKLIEIDIKEQLMSIKEDYKRIKRTAAIQAIGAQAVSWMLYVFLFFVGEDNKINLLLPGGSVVAASSVLFSKFVNDKMHISKNPLQFIYLISNKYNAL